MSGSKQLRLAINAYFAHHPLTGSGQYLSGLLGGLNERNDVALSTYIPNRRGGVRESWLDGERASSTDGDVHPLAKLRFELFALPAAVGRRVDVLHYPYWAAPLSCHLPVVVTVHDIIPHVLDAYRGALAARAYTAVAAIATRRATLVLADSEASKRDIVEHLGLARERVAVVHLAAGPEFRPDLDHDKQVEVRKKYELEGPFTFYVGGLDTRKNVPLLIGAFARALPFLSPGEVLAIAGDHRRRGPLFSDLTAVAKQHGMEGAIRFLGEIPRSELPFLYKSASVVAYPSTYEGFGLPPLEALACGAPLICSQATSLREVVGEAGILLDPCDTDAWVKALIEIHQDDGLRADLSRRGPRHATNFTWRITTEQTVAAYREATVRYRRESSKCA